MTVSARRLLLLIFLCWPAAAAITLVQQTTGVANSGTSLGMTLSGAPATGDILILVTGVTTNGSNYQIASVVETNVVWAGVIKSNSGTTAEMWYGVVSSSASTSVTINFAGTLGGNNLRTNISEWSGLSTTPLDQSHAVSDMAVSATIDAGPITPAASHNALLIAMAESAIGSTGGPNNSFTGLSSSGGVAFNAGYRIVTATSGSYSTSWTQSSPQIFDSVMADFLAPSGVSQSFDF